MPKRLFWKSVGNLIRKHDSKRRAYREAISDDYAYSIGSTKLVSSRGILASTDVHPVYPRSGMVDTVYLDKIPEILKGFDTPKLPSVYVCGTALKYFAKNVLPRIENKFVLVSGDSTVSVCEQTLGNEYGRILQSDAVTFWWAQNLVESGGRVQHMPVGMDFHTPWNNPVLMGNEHILPSMQEAELRKIISAAPMLEKRIANVYCDWVNSATYGDRQEALKGIDRSVLVAPTERMHRHRTWEECAKHAFVASPSGVGLDCHRTWEAIALGCIPIVKRGPLSGLFLNMPVVIVEDWREVTQFNLVKWHEEICNKQYDYSNLMLAVWRHRFESNEQQYAIPVAINDYISLF